jgi:hypothetical protein
MIKHNALDPKLVLVQDGTASNRGCRQLLPAEGLPCTEFAEVRALLVGEVTCLERSGECASGWVVVSRRCSGGGLRQLNQFNDLRKSGTINLPT